MNTEEQLKEEVTILMEFIKNYENLEIRATELKSKGQFLAARTCIEQSREYFKLAENQRTYLKILINKL
tara:strand:+ start:1250 stop:1456 length:207 start_codon:yes stop_codon:yes gene_type:complete